MGRDRWARLARELFDERSFGDRVGPFGTGRFLAIPLLLAAVGFGVGWLVARASGNPDYIDVGWMLGAGVGIGYYFVAGVGTAAFWVRDRLVRQARRRRAAGPFESQWSETCAAAFRALGRPPSVVRLRSDTALSVTVTEDLWAVVDDRPRATIMEAWARLERCTGPTAHYEIPPGVARALEHLRQLQRLAVHHETAIPPEKARTFLHLCDLVTVSLEKPR
jgi:hypothetical protein